MSRWVLIMFFHTPGPVVIDNIMSFQTCSHVMAQMSKIRPVIAGGCIEVKKP